MNRIRTIDLLKQADEAYYNKAESVMEDSEYTELKDKARALWPEDDYFKKVGAKPEEKSPWDIVKHSIPMGSIDNIKTESPSTFIQDIFTNTKKWWTKLGCPTLLAQYKVDGLSLNLEYVPADTVMSDGPSEESMLMNAVIRGDGIEGEDIFKNAIAIQGIKTSGPAEVHNVHCEVILPKRGLEVVNEIQERAGDKLYANCRNAAAGIARRFDGKYAKFLAAIPFDFIYEGKRYDSDAINQYKKYFGFVETVFIDTWEELEAFYKETLAKRAELPYDIDGIVVKVDDMALRSKDKPELPEWVRAMKFPPEENSFKVDTLRWYVGKTGKVTPVAHNHVGVQFQAKVIREVTLHNYNQFCKHKLASGDKISVVIAGDVIPKIESVLERSGQPMFTAPKNCPECGSLLQVDENFLYCTSEGCPGRIKSLINSHVKEMGIEEVGPELVEKLYKMGQVGEIKFNHFPDLYTLTTKDIMRLEGYQEKSAMKVITNIHARIEVSLAVFIASLGIPNIGAKTIEKFGNISLDDLFKMSLDNMRSIEGVGPKTAAQIKEGLDSSFLLIGQLFANGVKIKKAKSVTVTSDRFKGKSFCFTGDLKEINLDTGKPYTREEAWDIVKKNGGEVKSGVSKKLNVLVLAVMESGSNKATKARELGVEMISSKEFFKRAGIL
jgi:DNA ligase (NAD+)